jgi:hypothetical protein
MNAFQIVRSFIGGKTGITGPQYIMFYMHLPPDIPPHRGNVWSSLGERYHIMLFIGIILVGNKYFLWTYIVPAIKNIFT